LLGADRLWQASLFLWSSGLPSAFTPANVLWGGGKSQLAEGLLADYKSGQPYDNVVRAVDKRVCSPRWLHDALQDWMTSALLLVVMYQGHVTKR